MRAQRRTRKEVGLENALPKRWWWNTDTTNVESNALWSICMYTYLRKIGPPFVVNFFKLLFPPFLMNRNILHILLVKRSLVPYEALSCSIEYCVLFIILKGKLKRFGFVHENSKDLVLFMKTETFNAIINSHKRCFFISFYYDTPLGFGSLWTLMCTRALSVVCKKKMLSSESSP